MPDILVHNFPMGPNGVGILKGGAIFDIKTLRVDKTAVYYFKEGSRMKRRGVDTKCHVVKRDYMRRAEILDEKCNEDVNASYFADTLKHKFHSGGVYPMVFGAYRESDATTFHLITKCAKLAATRAENAHVTPLNDTNKKGSIYHTMLTQFRRALGVMATRTAAEIKIRRTGFIRDSISEADAIAQPMSSRFRGNNYSWYDNRQNEDLFNEFHAYHNQHHTYYTEE